ncbi:hypothetical protein C2W62_32660 [Candidatus Entotheonella serta]|nr:hypothetical protein C2W62_32660 [Candidatus Entotheonella serta]
MDEEYEHRGEEEAPHLTRKPSTFVHEGGNIFFGCEAEERMLGPTLDLIGHNTVMYASDWPHWDGGLLMEGLLSRDFPVVQGMVLLAGSMIVVVNLLVDVLYAYVDPRIRLTG